MKWILPAIALILTLLQGCQNAVSDEDMRDSIEVIRAADSMLKLDTARNSGN